MVVIAPGEGPHSRIRARIREAERRLLHFLGGRSSRDVEYDFVWRNVVGEKLKILDIGGCDSLLPVVFAKQGHDVTVYDFRRYTERHANLVAIQGDFLYNDLPGHSFDYVILVSTIEHIGFGSYGAPRYEDGDIEVIKEVKRVLAEDGKVILTFPFAEREKEIRGFERWYDVDRVKRLFEDMHVWVAEYWIPRLKVLNRWVKWVPAVLRQAQSSPEPSGCPSVACFVVSLKPFEPVSL
jgi:SAM-dependent methyltransferase